MWWVPKYLEELGRGMRGNHSRTAQALKITQTSLKEGKNIAEPPRACSGSGLGCKLGDRRSPSSFCIDASESAAAAEQLRKQAGDCPSQPHCPVAYLQPSQNTQSKAMELGWLGIWGPFSCKTRGKNQFVTCDVCSPSEGNGSLSCRGAILQRPKASPSLPPGYGCIK